MDGILPEEPLVCPPAEESDLAGLWALQDAPWTRAFPRFWGIAASAVTRHLSGYSRPGVDPENIVADSVVGLIHFVRRQPDSPQPLKRLQALLTSIAYNKTASALRACGARKHGGGKIVSFDEHEDQTGQPMDSGSDASSPADEAARAELVENLNRALGQLSPEKRTVLQLKYFDGLTLSEMATRLACSETKVTKRFCAAQDDLKRLLSKTAHFREELRGCLR